MLEFVFVALVYYINSFLSLFSFFEFMHKFLNNYTFLIIDSPTNDSTQALSMTGFSGRQTYLPHQMVPIYCCLLDMVVDLQIVYIIKIGFSIMHPDSKKIESSEFKN